MSKRHICPVCDYTMVRNGHTPAGKQRWICDGRKKGCGYTTTNPKSKSAITQSGNKKEQRGPLRFTRKLGGETRFIITSAQNATPRHDGFFEALKGWAKFNDGELVIIPIRYKNPTSRWSISQQNAEIWDGPLTPYLYNRRKKLSPNLVLLGDIKTRPTAESPLTGFEGITHGESGILGHSKIQLKVIPTPQSSMPKILTTTGSCTVKNYTDSKAGKKGEFHHVIGAVVVEISGKTFHMRQIHATNDGSFIDLENEYHFDGNVTAADPALGLVLGDLHYRFLDKGVERATFGPGGIVETLDPEVLVFHDLLDEYARNPHHRDDPFAEMAKRSKNWHLVRKEIEETIEWLHTTTAGRQAIVVPSNHDAFLKRWIVDTNWKRDPDNAEFYLETALQMVKSTKMGPSGHETVDPFIYWADKLGTGDNVSCLGADDSFMLGPWECGMHGHQGPNGARGSIKNLSRLGVRVISGHGHSPGLEEGHTRVGTSTPLRLEYNAGPSSWLNSHAVVYANQRRSLINIINGEWRHE